MQEENETSFDLYYELFSGIGSGMALYRAIENGNDFVFVDFNRSAEKIDGISKQEILGRRVGDVFPGIEAFGLLDVFRRVYHSGNAEHFPVHYYQDQRIDGWRENYVYRLEPDYIVAIYHDCPDGPDQDKTTLLEQKIIEEQERFRLALEGCKDGLWDWNMRDDSLIMSDTLETMLGYVPGELPRTMEFWYEQLHPDDDKQTRRAIREYLDTKGKGTYDNLFRMRRKDGSYAWIRSRGKALFDETGNPLRFVGFNTDITKDIAMREEIGRLNEKLLKLNASLSESIEYEVTMRMEAVKEKEEQYTLLVQQSKMAELGEMVAVIAHQMKQPLSIIAMYEGIIEEVEYQSEEDALKAKEALTAITQQIQYMSETITSFKEYTTPNRRKRRFKGEEAVQDVYNMVQHVFKKQGIAISIQEHAHFEVLGYPNEVKNVIMNILNNAKDAYIGQNVSKKRIDVRFEVNHEFGRIYIRDNAGGISEELLPDTLFDPYVTTKMQGGTGIGLQIARNIIESRMKGKLWAHNVEEGAEFVIELPLANQ